MKLRSTSVALIALLGLNPALTSAQTYIRTAYDSSTGDPTTASPSASTVVNPPNSPTGNDGNGTYNSTKKTHRKKKDSSGSYQDNGQDSGTNSSSSPAPVHSPGPGPSPPR